MFDGSDNSSEAVAEAPAATAKADAIGFYHDVMSAIGSCDRAGGAVSNAGQSGDMVALYQAADAMEAACLSTSSDVRAIDVPKTVGKKVYEDLTNAREACENAYLNRWSAAGSMKEALDDMGSISRQAELRQASEATQAGILACAAGLMGGAMEAGATTEELGIGS